MKYIISPTLNSIGGLIYTVTEKSTGRICYRVEGRRGNSLTPSEFYIYGDSEGQIYETNRSDWTNSTHIGNDYVYCVSLGDFHTYIQRTMGFPPSFRYPARGTAYHGDGLLGIFYGFCENKKEIATMRVKVFSLGKYIVNIKEESVSRDAVFGMIFGILAIQAKNHRRNLSR